jgi:hypothetical protein
VQILTRLDRHLLPVAIELELRTATEGGLSFESPLVLTAGTLHAFRLAAPGGETVTIRARVVRCLRTTGSGEPRYLTDVEFVTAGSKDAGGGATRPYFVRSLERVLSESRRRSAFTGIGPTGD